MDDLLSGVKDALEASEMALLSHELLMCIICMQNIGLAFPVGACDGK